jgi:hypothetical protein
MEILFGTRSENYTHKAIAGKINIAHLLPLFFVNRRSNYALNIFPKSCCFARVIKCNLGGIQNATEIRGR